MPCRTPASRPGGRCRGFANRTSSSLDGGSSAYCFRLVGRKKRVGAAEIRLTPADEPAIAGVEREVGIHDQLERGLARISPEQRAVVVLVYYLDLPLAEAAQAMGIPVGTTKSRLNRATQALRAALEADDREPSRVREQIA